MIGQSFADSSFGKANGSLPDELEGLFVHNVKTTAEEHNKPKKNWCFPPQERVPERMS